MSLFPRSRFTADVPRFPGSGDFAPLFRLLDDYASHQLERESTNLRSFTPKFDVKENKEAYELHGELPGIDQKDVQIEFSDPTTLVIKGRTERHHESGTQPSGLIGDKPEQGRIGDSDSSYHKPTVEEEAKAAGENKEQQQSSEVTKTDGSQEQANGNQQQQEKKKEHYWISERSIGEFHRSFSFPARVDQDNVKASLKNGILSIIVPKAQGPTSRRINIDSE